jgi:predicted nucleic acid-binding Zn ribbon protein
MHQSGQQANQQVQHCRACGAAYPLDTPICPRCRVPRKGDVNKPALLAYSIFILVMVILAGVMLLYLSPHR